MSTKLHYYLCTCCGLPNEFKAGTIATCPECGGRYIDSGKTYKDWESAYEQQPDSLPRDEIFNVLNPSAVHDFIRKQVIEPLNTFNKETRDAVLQRSTIPTGLHCPRCFSTNVETDGGGVEYGSDGIGSTGPGWDLGNGLVATINDRGICKNCGYMWPL